MAVDPGNDTQLENPQSWNKYAYVENNPLKYLDPNGEFKIVGANRHQNISRAASPQAAHVSQRDVVQGNRRADTSRIFKSNDAAHLNEGGPTGSATDTRVQAGVDQLGSALNSLAAGNLEAAGEALGASHHSFQDLAGHGGVTGDQHDAQNLDSSSSAGFDTRKEGATALTGAINGIFNEAAAAILAGGDVNAIVGAAQESATQAAQGAYNDTKAKLEKAGKKPEGY